MAAYNAGSGYWIVNETPPYRSELVTSDATDFDDGTLISAQEARGLGDCWGSEQWAWGGTWELPALATEIR